MIRECDERGRELHPVDPLEKAKLQRDCLRHATRRNGIIDWEAYCNALLLIFNILLVIAFLV